MPSDDDKEGKGKFPEDNDNLFRESDDKKPPVATNAELAAWQRNEALRAESERAEAKKRAHGALSKLGGRT
jgi:hypothetical protein